MLRLQVHYPSDEIIVDGKRIVPKPSEMAIISELFLNRKRVVSYKKLENAIRRIDHAKDLYRRNGDKATQLAVYICTLRKLLGSAADIVLASPSGAIRHNGHKDAIGYMLIVKTTKPLLRLVA